MMKRLKNELCECGHLGGSSLGTFNSHKPRFERGHGECIECDCKQFTWVKFVDQDGNDEQQWERI